MENHFDFGKLTEDVFRIDFDERQKFCEMLKLCLQKAQRNHIRRHVDFGKLMKNMFTFEFYKKKTNKIWKMVKQEVVKCRAKTWKIILILEN